MISGVRIALDVGSVRIGVAKCDAEGLLATPMTTISAGPDALREVGELVQEYEAVCVYVGKPISLSGKDTASTQAAIEFAQELVALLGQSTVQVRLIDERLSTVSAQRGMHEAGRNIKQSRDAIDQAAAVVILEHALASERNSGALVGEEVKF
jgi:putative Holliday junction resolvase